MDVFRADGHLTDEALATLMQGGGLTELERLELAEHLAFCDQCLQRYTEALAGAPLLTPQTSCRESLWRRVRMRTWRLVTSRYATAAAAVALALTVVWGSGNLQFRPSLPPERPAASRLMDWPERWNRSLDRAVSGVSEFFGRIHTDLNDTIPGGTQP